MGCLICEKQTRMSYNKSTRVLCESCIALSMCEEDKKKNTHYFHARYKTYCDNCFIEYEIGFLNFCIQIRKRIAGEKAVCKKCRVVVNKKPKKYTCWKCGEKTEYKRKLCSSCFGSFIHPDSKNVQSKLETILDYCEKSDIIEDVYIFTSLTKINKKTLEVGLDEKFKKVSAIVSIYGVDKISIQERTNIDCFDDLVEHMNILKNHNKEIFYLNRTVHSKLSGNKNMHNIFNDSMCDEDLSKDSSYNTKEYTKDKNLISDRNGACKYSGKGDCGFNSNGYLVQCGWIVTDKIVGHISEGLEVLDKKLNSIIREQKMNIFDKKCSNCGAYEPYEND